MKNKHLDSATLSKRNSLSSLSSGKASIQLSSSKSPGTPLAAEIVDDDNASDAIPERTVSSSTSPLTPTNQSPRNSNEKKSVKDMSDFDIIADIIANATAAASSKTGAYSSLSSGKASIASEPIMTTSSSTASTPTTNRRSTLNTLFGGRSKSETTFTATTPSDTLGKSPSRSSLLFNASSLFTKKKQETEEERELKDAGVTLKEIKGTLGKLVVPKEIANPMPTVRLEAPQHARLNR